MKEHTKMKTKMIQVAILGWMIVVFAGCATGPPTTEELAAADYGTMISQEDAEPLANAWLDTHLKDPLSAQKRWKPLYKGWLREAPIHGGSLRFGYRLEGEINARNSFGGYTGFKPYIFMFHNGKIVSIYGQQELRGSYGSTPYIGKLY